MSTQTTGKLLLTQMAANCRKSAISTSIGELLRSTSKSSTKPANKTAINHVLLEFRNIIEPEDSGIIRIITTSVLIESTSITQSELHIL